MDEKNLKKLAKIVAEELGEIKLLLLIGELGSGKTTFVRGFVTHFGLDESVVKSPTFSILNIYKGSKVIYHMDLYRVEQPDEEILMEIEEALEQNNTVLIIEWADRIENFWPEKFLKIKFDFCDEGRTVLIECFDEKLLEKISSRWFGGKKI
ncbi:tRNA (adenosine(37)-N6)-threonylcarbamoyltransferase complex ATPase subunit type 1 TsaE [Pseudothermotoga thermarum]|uniref:tRNA (adenosine(37)-N6)-threonylcarbamoyltransferase complex ATPase subunit type 1 TsaE n=1 Tax=Pseudothermotoga thermarum TaxID=119394 RepID=UPI001FE114B5|nr:tRNA (adenosine(37)-N6)-threonylcarbamoyltransferase complex ATPase subunit type 1 TsaE [Pseudothermotoga thermarum]